MYLSRLLVDQRSRHVRRDLADCHQLHRTIMRAFPDLALAASASAPVLPVALGTTFPLDLAEGTLMPPAADARVRLGVLHRVEVHPRTGEIGLLVQSAARPDWTSLPAGYLASHPGVESAAVKLVRDAYAAISSGEVLLFRLRANPTKRLPPTAGPDGVRRDGKRVELQREDEQLNWLVRKGGDHGFQIVNAAVRPGLEAHRTASRAAPVLDVRATSATRTVGHRGADVGRSSAGRRVMTFGDVLFEGRLRVIDPDAFKRALASGIGSGKAYGFGLLSVARAPA